MPSFKQFLVEDTFTYDPVQIVEIIKFDQPLGATLTENYNKFYKIVGEVCKKVSNVVDYERVPQDGITLTTLIKLRPLSEFSPTKLIRWEAALNDALNAIEDELNNFVSSRYSKIVFNEKPTGEIFKDFRSTSECIFYFNEQFTELSNVHKSLGFYVSHPINFKDTKHVKERVLSVLLIKNITAIFFPPDAKDWVRILNKHIQIGKDILECKAELIERGFSEYAKL